MAEDEFQLRPLAPPRVSETAPEFMELMGASLRSESGLSAIINLAGRERFPRDPNFALDSYFTRRPDMFAYQDRFEDVQSDAEALAVESRIKQELKDRAIREAAGFAGFAADMAAMVASPDIFLPVGVAGRGMRMAGRAAAGATLQAGVHEFTMQAAQETRTAAESQSAMIGAAILGSVLGGAVGMFSRAEFDAAAKMVLAEPELVRLRPPYNPSLDRSIGAMEVGGVRMADPGQLRGVLSPEELGSATFRQRVDHLVRRALGQETVLTAEELGNATPTQRMMSKALRVTGYPSPVARNLLSRFPRIRGIQAQLADGGLYFEEGVVAAPGGTIEQRIRRITNTYEAKGTHILNDAYTRYYRGTGGTTVLDRARAEIGGLVPMGGKLTRRQFSEQVFIEAQKSTAQSGYVKEAAEQLRAQFYDPIFEEMKLVGIVPEDATAESLMGELAYVTHIYNRDALVRNPEAFIEMVRKSYQRQMANEYGKRIKALKEAEAQDEADLADMVRPAEEVESLRMQLEQEREVYRDSVALSLQDSLRAAKREIAQLRDEQSLVGPGTDPTKPVFPKRERMAALEKRVKELTELLKDPEVARTVAADKAAARRLAVLSGSKAALTKRQEKIFEAVEARDEEAIRVLRGVSRSIAKMNDELDEMTDAAFAQARKELTVEIKRANRRLAELDKKGAELEAELNFRHAEGEEVSDFFNKDQLRLLQGKLRATQRIEDSTEVLEGLRDPAGARAILKEWQDDVITDTTDRLRRIADRRARLIERAKEVDPKLADARMKEIRAAGHLRQGRLADWVAEKGGALTDDVPDFTEGGRALGKDVHQRIIGNPVSVVGLDLTLENGAELARALNIPLEEKLPWLETDMDRLVRIYTRSVIPGIELVRSGFGVNGAKALDEVAKVFDQEGTRIANMTVADLPGGGPKARAGESPEALAVRQNAALAAEKERLSIANLKERNNTMLAFTGQFQRLRHQRAIPDNPDSWLYRGGRTLSQWNVLDMMGNVAVSQITDAALAVTRLGVRRIFAYAIKPMVHDFKQLRMSQREALYMGLDELQTQARLYQMSDMLEDAGTRRTKGEQAVEWLANKMGMVGLFTPMNHAVRQVLMPAVTGKLFDAMEVIHAGKTLHGVSVQKATNILAEANLDGDMVSRIWAMRGEGGIVNHNGLWVPNTESWTDIGAREAFRQAAMDTMDNVILVPGLERPLFVDKTMGHKLLTQFQSFMWSAHTRVLMAGLQKRDFDVAMGFLASLPLAALSYYVTMVAQGKGEEAREQGWDVWADEIVARHPMVGALAFGLKVGQEIPATRPYLQFSDRGSERRLSSGVFGAVAGPSYTTLNRAAKLVTEMDSPTQSTLHTARTLYPYNQVFYARWLFDKIEKESAGMFPKQRED